MCGIHGLLSLRPQTRPDPATLDRMGAVTRHRGPDDDGRLCDGPLAMGMRRLSIIDVAGGHQPLANEDETVWVVCNGEIYNFRETRRRLEGQGHRFRSGSDAEVIVHLYEEHGEDLVRHLDGMFAFALWDRKLRKLLIARDRLGIKPLYLRTTADHLAFASEAKALLELPGMRAEVDAAAVAEYLALGYVPTPLCIFRGMTKLPPATLLVCEAGQIRTRRYWTLESASSPDRSPDEWVEMLRAQLERSVVSQMVSDVPIGAFLSGGLDSSTVVALMARHSPFPVKTYSIGFEATSGAELYNELPFARRAAELFGTEHHEIIVQPDMCALLPRLLWHMDEPICDAAFLTTYLVAEFARRDVTVILSGVGGDELFGGYNRYLSEHYLQHYRRLPAWFRRTVLQPLARRLPADRHSRIKNISRLARSFLLSGELDFAARYRSYVEVFAPELRGLVAPDVSQGQSLLEQALAQAADADTLRGALRVDLATQLPDDLLLLTDKMTMATSLECRVPLLDTALVELSMAMPSDLKVRGRELKYALKRAVTDLLPPDILRRRKRGFGAPVGAWIKRELSGLLGSVLSAESVAKRGLFSWPAIARIIEDHRASKADYTDHLLALLNFEIWSRIYLDGCQPADIAAELEERMAA
ncbi:MAG TPA: asparagine synthase (glutamine-hydrolyzing) [Steroidobacteraceae bacterium]|nr:asparagine synthase (glutamine-hydrolyzing) [Steroidobacteraceae bacterium]